MTRSAGPLVEQQGFAWVSTATAGLAAAAPSEVRVVHRSADGRELTAYEALADEVRFVQPAVGAREVFYVIEGAVRRAERSGMSSIWRTGDMGFQAYDRECELTYARGTRLVRFLFADDGLPPEAGRPTRGPLSGPAAASGGDADAGASCVHVFDPTEAEVGLYHGARHVALPVFTSADARRSAFHGSTPDGVRFLEHPGDIEESFYVVQGTVQCTPVGGETIVWRPGDLVYWPYELETENVYSAGMACVLYFWSDRPMPDLVGGDAVTG